MPKYYDGLATLLARRGIAAKPAGEEASVACSDESERRRMYHSGVEGWYVVLQDSMGHTLFLLNSSLRETAIGYITDQIGRIDVSALRLLRVSKQGQPRGEDFSDAYKGVAP